MGLAKFQSGDRVRIKRGCAAGEVKTVFFSVGDGHPDDRRYTLRDADGTLDEGYREYELEKV